MRKNDNFSVNIDLGNRIVSLKSLEEISLIETVQIMDFPSEKNVWVNRIVLRNGKYLEFSEKSCDKVAARRSLDACKTKILEQMGEI